MSPNPNSLPTIARHLFSICPNSASCERGFSSLGWLTHKLRVQIDIEKLKSMSKMITYWKSNAEKEFGFYGKQSKDKQKLNEIELNKRVTEALAEVDDFDEEIDEAEEVTVDTSMRSNTNERRTTSGELIPDDNVIVLIENLWIETNIDLSHKLILEDIGEIPENDFDNIDEVHNSDVEMNNETGNIEGKNIMDYNIDDLVNKYAMDD